MPHLCPHCGEMDYTDEVDTPCVCTPDWIGVPEVPDPITSELCGPEHIYCGDDSSDPETGGRCYCGDRRYPRGGPKEADHA